MARREHSIRPPRRHQAPLRYQRADRLGPKRTYDEMTEEEHRRHAADFRDGSDPTGTDLPGRRLPGERPRNGMHEAFAGKWRTHVRPQ